MPIEPNVTSLSPSVAERGKLMTDLLPSNFADLEVFADWILVTEEERYTKRLASSMTDMQTFYDTAMPRLDAIMEHSAGVPIGDAVVADADRNLAYLAFSLVMVSFPIESWKQPHVPDSGAAAIPLTIEPGF